MITTFHPFIDVARGLAVRAGERLMQLRLTPLQKERKADHSLVTNADRDADVIIREGLRQAFPDHAILTEESGIAGPSTAEYIWVVDPLDGTKSYARGTPGFSVMIGLLKEGEPFAGVVFDPWEGHIYEAVKGMGAYHLRNGARQNLHVSSRRAWAEMPLAISTGFPENLVVPLKARLSSPWLSPINSVGIKVGLVVRQEADLYLNHHPVHYWDTLAPQVILEEAGGVFTLMDGRPLAYDLTIKDYVHALAPIASNGQRHAEFVALVKDLFVRG